MQRNTHILFLDFGGVLHPDAVYLSRQGPTLKAEGTLFMWAPILAKLLDDFPMISLVLSTSWVRHLGYKRALGFLPLELRERVIGATWHSSMAKGWVDENQWDGRTRYDQICRYAARSKLRHWIALDDDVKGWAPALRSGHEIGKGRMPRVSFPTTAAGAAQWVIPCVSHTHLVVAVVASRLSTPLEQAEVKIALHALDHFNDLSREPLIAPVLESQPGVRIVGPIFWDWVRSEGPGVKRPPRPPTRGAAWDIAAVIHLSPDFSGINLLGVILAKYSDTEIQLFVVSSIERPAETASISWAQSNPDNRVRDAIH